MSTRDRLPQPIAPGIESAPTSDIGFVTRNVLLPFSLKADIAIAARKFKVAPLRASRRATTSTSISFGAPRKREKRVAPLLLRGPFYPPVDERVEFSIGSQQAKKWNAYRCKESWRMKRKTRTLIENSTLPTTDIALRGHETINDRRSLDDELDVASLPFPSTAFGVSGSRSTKGRFTKRNAKSLRLGERKYARGDCRGNKEASGKIYTEEKLAERKETSSEADRDVEMEISLPLVVLSPTKSFAAILGTERKGPSRDNDVVTSCVQAWMSETAGRERASKESEEFSKSESSIATRSLIDPLDINTKLVDVRSGTQLRYSWGGDDEPLVSPISSPLEPVERFPGTGVTKGARRCKVKYSWQAIGTGSQTSRTLLEDLTRECADRYYDPSLHECAIKYSWQIIGTATQTSVNDFTCVEDRSGLSFRLVEPNALRSRDAGESRVMSPVTVCRNGKAYLVLNDRCVQTIADKKNQTDNANIRSKR